MGRDETPPLWRTSGDNLLLSVGGPNVCSAEGLPRFAKRFHDNSRVDCLLKGIESTALPITLTRETRDVVLYWTFSYTGALICNPHAAYIGENNSDASPMYSRHDYYVPRRDRSRSLYRDSNHPHKILCYLCFDCGHFTFECPELDEKTRERARRNYGNYRKRFCKTLLPSIVSGITNLDSRVTPVEKR